MKRKQESLALLLICVILILCIEQADAATTIEQWSNAKAEYPASTNGTVGAVAGGIVWSRHNLSSYGGFFKAADPNVGSSGAIWTTEICVFCHTPHFSSSDAPLWNRGNSATYTAYGTTFAGTVISSVSSASLVCLSCHDGVTAFDTMINRPGPGPNVMGAAENLNLRFRMGVDSGGSGGSTALTTLDHFSTGNPCAACHDPADPIGLYIGIDYWGQIAGLEIGTSLTNEHPVSVVYNENVAGLRPKTTTINSIVMSQPQSLAGQSTYGRSDNLWAVNGYISDTATIADLLKNGMVECTSCHDPHYKNQTNDDPAVVGSYIRIGANGSPVTNPEEAEVDGLFLRRVGGNSNSGMCRTCHNK